MQNVKVSKLILPPHKLSIVCPCPCECVCQRARYLMCEAVSRVSVQLETVGMLSLSVLSLSMTGLPPACGVHSDAGSYGEHHR